jgi:hypothetical protein
MHPRQHSDIVGGVKDNADNFKILSQCQNFSTFSSFGDIKSTIKMKTGKKLAQ